MTHGETHPHIFSNKSEASALEKLDNLEEMLHSDEWINEWPCIPIHSIYYILDEEAFGHEHLLAGSRSKHTIMCYVSRRICFLERSEITELEKARTYNYS